MIIGLGNGRIEILLSKTKVTFSLCSSNSGTKMKLCIRISKKKSIYSCFVLEVVDLDTVSGRHCSVGTFSLLNDHSIAQERNIIM